MSSYSFSGVSSRVSSAINSAQYCGFVLMAASRPLSGLAESRTTFASDAGSCGN